MKNYFLLFISSAVLFAACSNEPKGPDACECAKEIHQLGASAPNYAKCQEARKDAKFANDFVKCTAGIVMNKDTSEIELDTQTPEFKLPGDGTYNLSDNNDKISWRGQKMNGKSHQGTINIKGGSIVVANGVISGGEITLDMTSLVDTDLTDTKSKEKLETHLKSDDFFAVTQFPEAKFVVKSSRIESGRTVLSGELTVKGKTQTIEFSALISGSGETTIVCSGGFQFDRSKHDVRYGSGSFFDNLGDDLIDDMITITFNLHAKK